MFHHHAFVLFNDPTFVVLAALFIVAVCARGAK